MADDEGENATRNYSHEETFQRAQEAQVECSGTKLPNRSTGIISLPPGSRGPKSLYLKRIGGSFGFTLRHFIIYPPDGLTEEDDLRLAAAGALTAPMETIFVRKVKNPGPAHQAGLQKGDRLVAVNGVQVIDKPYSYVIQLIQKSPPYLHLLVVPKEEDALQRLFTETAYNPISNQNFIPDSPPLDRRTAALSQQRFVPNSLHHNQHHQRPGGELHVDAQFWRSLRYPFGYHHPTTTTSRLEKRPQSYQSDSFHTTSSFDNKNKSHHSRRSQNEIYAEIQIHDAPNRSSQTRGQQHLGHVSHNSKAQPQVPLYKKMGRRASEGSAYRNNDTYYYYDLPEYCSTSSVLATNSDDDMVFVNNSQEINSVKKDSNSSSANMSLLTYPSSAGCRLSLNDDDLRRESTSSLTSSSSYADGSKDSLSSFDSNSTLTTGQETDDSAILSRYRKSFQQKEEFLKMPGNKEQLTQKEFYGRPKKLDRQQWPPQDAGGSPSRSKKPTHQNFQRVKNDIENERDFGQQQQGPMGVGVASPKERVLLDGSRMDYNNLLEGTVDSGHYDENPIDAYDDGDDKRVNSPTQLVYTRTKQFESGRPLPEDDPHLSDRTSFYKSELSKISAKRLVPNVSERAQEYEIRAVVDPRRDRETKNAVASTGQKKIQRDSRSLDSSDVSEKRQQSNGLCFRSNSADSWADSSENCEERRLQRQDTVVDRSSQNEVGQEIPSVVRRRVKNSTIADDERIARRESYLKATEGSRLHFECDLSDGETSPQVLRSGSVSDNSSSSASLERDKGREAGPFDKEKFGVVREAALNCKVTELDGKRPAIRSWRQTWAVLKGPKLFLYKDRNHQSPIGTSDLLEPSLSNGVDLRSSLVRVAEDYTKRKHVLRVSSVNPCRSELLLQAENGDELADWVKVLNEQGATATDVETKLDLSGNKQQAVPQSVPALTSVQVQGSRLSPQPIKSKTITSSSTSASSRNRSPTGQSPVSKTRKPSQNHAVDPNTSPKSKTWRGRVAKQFRKIQGASSPSSPTAPEGSTFGVPLDQCLPSTRNRHVPRFVEVCTDIVDERGLQTVGIYRVPGNNASITALSEEVNKNYEDVPTEDVKWNDVHVVSSLLKSFFRKLPDSLVTNTFYLSFIRADKTDDPKRRMRELKKLVKSLPCHNYHTLRHLVLHLNRVIENSETNKMDAKNVAIVFGPNIVRPEEETMADMVSNNSHQCKILVTLLNHANWFFSEDDDDCDIDLSTIRDAYEDNDAPTSNRQSLLESISKLEGISSTQQQHHHKEKNGALFSSIISAAQRKVKRKTKGPGSLPETKEEASSPVGSNSFPSFSPGFSPSDLKDIATENGKGSNIPTTVRDIESNKTTTTERVPWFNYATDQEEFQKRIEKFKNETEAMLTRPRYLEINVDKASRNSTSLITSNETGSHSSENYPITKTQSVSNVLFTTRTSSSTSNNAENRNSLNAIDSNANNSRITANFHHNQQQQQHHLFNNHYQKNGGNNRGTQQRYCQQSTREGAARTTTGGHRWNNNEDSTENDDRGRAATSTTTTRDCVDNGTKKKVKYENNQGEIYRSTSLDSVNKCGTDDDTDLVSAMTKLYDKKLEDYTTNQPIGGVSLLTGEGLPYVDDSPEKIRENLSSDKENRPRDLYKNPSLHKYLKLYNNNNNKEKEKNDKDDREKDEDENVHVPDNERQHLINNKMALNSSNTTNILMSNNNNNNKLRRSESLNKSSGTNNNNNNNKLVKRSESLNKNDKTSLKRSDSLTKTEKTESNISKKRELLTRRSKELKRKNGMPDRSIKRRHTVGGTKDPDKVTWLDKYQEEVNNYYCGSPDDDNDEKKENKDREKSNNMRTSSPDLSSTRRERLLFEINLIGPENMVVALKQHLMGARPQSFPDSGVFKVPLESHV